MDYLRKVDFDAYERAGYEWQYLYHGESCTVMGTVFTEVLPVASVPIVPVSVWIGLTIERAVKSAIVPAAPSPAARSAHSVAFRSDMLACTA